MTGLQKDVLEVILKSQLSIKLASHKELVRQQHERYSDSHRSLISMLYCEIEEIERQLNHLKT